MNLTNIKGIGEKRKKILEEYGIFDLEDLMSFFPSKFIDLSKAISPSDCIDGEGAVLRGKIRGEVSLRFIRRGLNIAKINVESLNGGSFCVVFYNRPYIKNQLSIDKEYIFCGKISKKGGIVSVLNPIFEGVDDTKSNAIYTVYPPLKGIPKSVLKETIQKNVPLYNPESIIPLSLREEYALFDLKDAYRALHFPNKTHLNRATEAVVVEELTQLILAYRLTKQKRPFRIKEYKDNTREIFDYAKGLPFSLTKEQENVLKEILDDLKSNKYMNRLLQGDVGSGKTIIAFLAMYFASLSLCQSVLMSPTEVLARQHFQKFSSMFPCVSATLLTGGMSKKEQDTARLNIASGTASVVFGTHSLFSESVKYADLRLVITDEQHRFGVSQRSALEAKARNVDTLLLSATPIPRTLALIMYGDLSLSDLPSALPGRMPVITRIVPHSKQNDMLEYIKNEAKKDNRTYIVMPKVEDGGEGEEADSVKAMYDTLKKGALKGVPLGLIYGTMNPKEKQVAFEDFRSGKTKVLVATTVIEVGVDVPEANIIAVFGADRFGLSQLHQLRGRVGRGNKESYCFLLSKDVKNERLDIITKTSNGFTLSEYDLKTRGAGDFIGLRQHGMSSLSNLNITNEYLLKARDIANRIWDDTENDFNLKLKKAFRKIIDSVVLN